MRNHSQIWISMALALQYAVSCTSRRQTHSFIFSLLSPYLKSLLTAINLVFKTLENIEQMLTMIKVKIQCHDLISLLHFLVYLNTKT